MAKSPPALKVEKMIYLVLKAIFHGPDALRRKPQAVLDVLIKNESKPRVQELVREHKMEGLCTITRSLLYKRVFESESFAKKHFPDLFGGSPNGIADQRTSEVAALTSEDAAIPTALPERQNVSFDHPQDLTSGDGRVETQTETIASIPNNQPHPQSLSRSVPSSFFPVLLPFPIQHRLFRRVQDILESACFDFAKKNLNEILEEQGWDCAEKVEVTTWCKIFDKHQDMLNVTGLSFAGKSLSGLLNSISQLRHAASHRHLMTANQFLKHIDDALFFVQLLQVDEYVSAMVVIRQQLGHTIESMERNKRMLDFSLAETRKRYALKMAELIRLEQEENTRLMKRDKEYDSLAGVSLQKALETLEIDSQSPDAVTMDKSNSALVLTDNVDYAAVNDPASAVTIGSYSAEEGRLSDTKASGDVICGTEAKKECARLDWFNLVFGKLR